MSIQRLTVSGYRSIYRIGIALSRANVIVGPNGCGKSNLYRSMYLLAEAANGRLAQALADEGGMPSVLWAGERQKGPVRMTLGVTTGDYSYELSCGLPIKSCTAFHLDPEVKEEKVWLCKDVQRRVYMLERKGTSAWVRDVDGRRVPYPLMLSSSETALSQIREPHLYPELSSLRMEMNEWRFFHHFPTDGVAAARNPQLGVRTPLLSHDGRDLAAAIQTILEAGDSAAVHDAIQRVIPGAELRIEIDPQSRMAVELRTPGVTRWLMSRELSDGTLRFLYLLAALLSPRPPALIALNEPETSLHPDVLDPLARLIAAASQQSQIWIVTHSERLAACVAQHTSVEPIRLQLVDGQTRIVACNEVCDEET